MLFRPTLRAISGDKQQVAQFGERGPVVLWPLCRIQPPDCLRCLGAFDFGDLATALEAFKRLQERLPVKLPDPRSNAALFGPRNHLQE